MGDKWPLTFDEWYTEKSIWGSVEREVLLSFEWDRDSLSSDRIKELLKESWEASRQNMTYKDI